MDIFFAIGATGLFLLLLAYALTMAKKLAQDSVHYQALNFIGSVLLVAYALKIGSIIFVALNTIWGLIALGFIVKKIAKA